MKIKNYLAIKNSYSCVVGTVALSAVVVFLTITTAAVFHPVFAGEVKSFIVPKFRFISQSATEPALNEVRSIRFLTSDDFPPFSYRDTSNKLTGFDIAVADGVCRILRAKCQFIIKPFNQIADALAAGEADAAIAGLQVNNINLEKLDFTRPYYRPMARFVVRRNDNFTNADNKNFSGKRLGVIAGSGHADYLKTMFARSKLRQFKQPTPAYEALRTSAIDVLFGDALKIMFWLKSDKSHDCCQFIGDGFIDPERFSPPLAMAVARGNSKMREYLDYGLDRMQASGRFDRVYRQFFPMSTFKDEESKLTDSAQ